jgi:hypothetical protein
MNKFNNNKFSKIIKEIIELKIIKCKYYLIKMMINLNRI